MNRDDPPAPIGVIVIGGGDRADLYLSGLAGQPLARLVGVVDSRGSEGDGQMRETGDVRRTDDLEVALTWPDVSACIVCVPPGAHLGLGEALAEAGKHVLMVEPLTESADEARRLHSLFTNSDLVLMPARPERFRDYAITVRSEVDQGHLGRIVLVRLALQPDHPTGPGSPSSPTHMRFTEGALDLVRWWVGDVPSSVYALGLRDRPGLALDYTCVTVQFMNGATAVVEIDDAHNPGSPPLRHVYVLGTEGALDMPWDERPNVLVGAGGSIDFPCESDEPHLRMIRSWLSAIRDGGTPLHSLDETVSAMAIRTAAEASLHSGDVVSIAQGPGSGA